MSWRAVVLLSRRAGRDIRGPAASGLLLLAVSQSWAAAPVAAPREVVRSTAPLSAVPANIPEFKRRIQADQNEILKARTALKRAQKRKDRAAESKANEEWRKAKERLKADRDALRKAIVAGEKEDGERRRVRQELRKHETIKP